MSRLLEDAGASTSHNPTDLHGLLQEQLYLIFLHGIISQKTELLKLKLTSVIKENGNQQKWMASSA
jgi:hypothetical protein